MMRTTACLALSLFALTTACSNDHVTGSDLSPLASRAADPARPAGGACAVSFQFGPPDLTHVPIPQATLTLTGECTFKHLGATTMTATQWIYAYPDFENLTTYTAANGDQLTTRFIGTLTSAPAEQLNLTFVGEETILSGTGRFAGATGSSILTGSAMLATGKGQYTTTGSMRY